MRRLLPVIVLALLAVGCGGGDDEPATPASTATTTTSTAAPAAGCARVPAPAPREDGDLKAPAARLRGPATVTLRTSCGAIVIRLATGRAPRTTSSFANLVRRGFYDGLTFHRIVPGFVIQGGDPRGDGTGGPGYTVVEAPPSSLSYTRGTVAMAKGGDEPSGASGSQFFIVTGADAGLPPDYALVGRVVGGDRAVDRIAAVPADAQERPETPVVITRATLRTG